MISVPELRIEGDHYFVCWEGLQAEFSHLTETGGAQFAGLNGEIHVTTTLPGIAPHLHQARINLSSTSARNTLAATLKKRLKDDSSGIAPADDFVEMACTLVLRAFRRGDPFIDLAGEAYQEPQFSIGSLFPLDKRCQVYAPAENLKTTLLLAFAMDVATDTATLGFPVKAGAVALMDWETDRNDAANIWHRLAQARGLSRPPSMFYRRCHQPIWLEAESAALEFHHEGVCFAILDSAFWACGGNPNDQVNVGQMFGGIDALGTMTTVLLNHTSAAQADKERRRHYGLEHFRNAVRASWELRKAENPPMPQVQQLGLYRDKLNMRRHEGPFGFEVWFDGESGPISVSRNDELISDTPSLDASRPATDRILDELTHGRATLSQLEKQLNLPPGTIKSAVYRLKNKVQGRQIGKDYFYELADNR